jgi:hypothetical protein
VDPRFDNNSQITLDRFELEVVDETAKSSLTPASSTNTFATSTPTSDASISESARPSIGVIAGGVVGGVIALLLLLALGFFLGRRRRRKDVEGNTAQPFDIQRLPPSDMSQHHSASTIPYLSSDTQTTQFGSGRKGLGVSDTFPSTLQSTSVSSSALVDGIGSLARSQGSARGLRRETDAGRVDVGNDDDDDARTLPPEYEQVFRRNRDERALRAVPPSTFGSDADGPYGSLTSHSHLSPTDVRMNTQPLHPQRKS